MARASTGRLPFRRAHGTEGVLTLHASRVILVLRVIRGQRVFVPVFRSRQPSVNAGVKM